MITPETFKTIVISSAGACGVLLTQYLIAWIELRQDKIKLSKLKRRHAELLAKAKWN